MFFLRAACFCHIGAVRLNNEDNFLFNQIVMDEKHHSLAGPLSHKAFLHGATLYGVFDGMGGELNGEAASYAAAQCARQAIQRIPSKYTNMLELLNFVCQDINLAVYHRAEDMHVSRMGSTLALLCLKGKYAYTCNLGDSRIFRLRDNTLVQLSEDHTDEQELKKRGIQRKPRLTQHLGINPEEMIIEPHIASFELKRKDIFLLCSDGLTDMLTNMEIQSILQKESKTSDCVHNLVNIALGKGGKDNITAIICQIL